jgi:threonyl-tRNA synthetase
MLLACSSCVCVLQENGTVNVRTRDNVVHGMHKVSDLKLVLAKERDSRSQSSAFANHADGQQQQPADS